MQKQDQLPVIHQNAGLTSRLVEPARGCSVAVCAVWVLFFLILMIVSKVGPTIWDPLSLQGLQFNLEKEQLGERGNDL
jgi:hypothetical protein